MSDLPKPDYARNIRVIGHSDQGGHPDGVQLMVHRGFGYIGHMFSKGFSVLDLRERQQTAPSQLHPRTAQHVDYSSPDARRPAACDPRQGHVCGGGIC
jgi:hypothetical protein